MRIAIETINKIHHLRTAAHVDCLNYFAGLLGYHFPEHDNDKNSGPMRTGYAHINYAKYHPEFTLTEHQIELYNDMHDEHHRMQPHHLEYYGHDVSKISDITLIEMICDWHSANFEQRFITFEDRRDFTVSDYFNQNLCHDGIHDWSQHQLTLINDTIEFLSMYANHDAIMKIWFPVMSA